MNNPKSPLAWRVSDPVGNTTINPERKPDVKAPGSLGTDTVSPEQAPESVFLVCILNNKTEHHAHGKAVQRSGALQSKISREGTLSQAGHLAPEIMWLLDFHTTFLMGRWMKPI